MDKYPYHKAAKAANHIFHLLQPHCQLIHIAGSIRRLRPDVKDIEIVCIPKKEFKQTGLFPEEGEHIISKDFTEALATITDAVLLGNINGRQMKIRTNSKLCPGIHLDLFMPNPPDYYRQYAIRTGSADYAHHVIASAWKRHGWVGTEDGLRRRDQCTKKSSGWHCHVTNPDKPPQWKSEAEFFRWLSLNYTDPEYRQLNKPVNEYL